MKKFIVKVEETNSQTVEVFAEDRLEVVTLVDALEGLLVESRCINREIVGIEEVVVEGEAEELPTELENELEQAVETQEEQDENPDDTLKIAEKMIHDAENPNAQG